MEKNRKKLLFLIAIAFWILVWQAAVSAANRNLLIPVPTPVSTGKALVSLAKDPGFYRAVFSSVLRIAAGFAGAFAAGTVLAVLDAKFTLFRIFTSPLLSLIRAIPVASFTILVFLWVERAKIPSVISFFTVLPIIWATISSGLRDADSGLVEMARVFGMPGGAILKEILLPGIRPFFTAAVVNGIGFAWKSGVAAEVITRTGSSVGNLLWEGKTSVDYDEVFAVTIVIVILSAALETLAKRLLRDRAKSRA